MIDQFFSYVCENAHHAHWIIFSLLILSAFNIPISEEFLILSGGAIAATCIPDHIMRLYVWVFLGCYLSAWVAYSIGRFLGPHLFKIALFSRVITPERLETLRYYYAKFGVFTFIIGRFCPGGIRNALFISSGFTRMPFHLFILRDGLACLISTSVFFTIGYHFGKNYHAIIQTFLDYEHWVLGLLGALLIVGLIYYWLKKPTK